MSVPAIAGSLSHDGLSGLLLCLVFLTGTISAPAQQTSTKPVPPSAVPQKATSVPGQPKAADTHSSEAPPVLRELTTKRASQQ